MASAFHFWDSEIHFRLNTEYVPVFANELAPLFPRFDTWPGLDWDWIGVVCDHPKYPRSSWYDSPTEEIVVRYRVGKRHQYLLAKHGKEWALRRVALLMRLLLKRLAHEVAKVAET